MTKQSFSEPSDQDEKHRTNQIPLDNNSCVDGIPLNIQSLRKTYVDREEPFLREKDMLSCPFEQFSVWFGNAITQTDLKYEEVNGFALSTVSSNGRPSSRMLLLKGFSKAGGFVFFTHSNSKKGKELSENPYVSALFYWPKVNRQIRIEGRVEILGEEVADVYWSKRPIESRIGSKLSDQSSVIPNREHLARKQRKLEELCSVNGEEAITRPSDWLSYSLRPNYFEFWQGQTNRVHDRIVYTQNSGETEWKMARLSP
ncbi:hypothetical protein niasHT_030447 [Heterodera trifolii]|uniref:Pyridoxine-5'-phosphate oxidase n=1 Tax=Heterodera trifolii TaxID=157864 RepID=A0ABD2J227_9BILA